MGFASLYPSYETVKGEAVMNAYFKLAITSLLAIVFAIGAHAEDAGKSLYAVVYVEVMAGKEKDARRLLLDHAADARKAAGALSIDALARDGYPDQFVLLEQWQSQKAWDDYAATSAAQQFRTSLGKIESAGVDERIQEALFVDSAKPAAVPPLAVITHIDIIPTALDRGRNAVKQLVDSNRGQDGNLRFDVVVQTNRQNHMTLIEGWKRPDDKARENAAASTVAFRHALLPVSGSPYDERVYRPLRN
jgi:quinol monooxygenase YgiN